MNKNEKNSKRVIIGSVIFAVLIGLNLVVRYSRSSRLTKPTTPTPITTAIPYPTSESPSLSSVQTTAKSKPEQSASSNISGSETSSLIPGSEQQMLALYKKLEELKNELLAMEKPFPAPDLRINLQLARFDRFRWKLPLIVATETVFIPPEPVIASKTKTVEILGIFRVRGRSKLLVREDKKVFLVNENEEQSADSIIVERTATDSYLVFDRDGSSHDLQLKQPQENGVEKAINILKGKREHQPSFDMQMSEPATGSEQLLNNSVR